MPELVLYGIAGASNYSEHSSTSRWTLGKPVQDLNISGNLLSLNPFWKTEVAPQEVLSLTDYEGSHQRRKGNIFLLNASFKDNDFSYPLKAELDIPIHFTKPECFSHHIGWLWDT